LVSTSQATRYTDLDTARQAIVPLVTYVGSDLALAVAASLAIVSMTRETATNRTEMKWRRAYARRMG
jgi:hypothetical protein